MNRNPEFENNPPPPYREEIPPPYSVPKPSWTGFRTPLPRNDIETANSPSTSPPSGDDTDTTSSPTSIRGLGPLTSSNDDGMGCGSECWANICTNLVLLATFVGIYLGINCAAYKTGPDSDVVESLFSLWIILGLWCVYMNIVCWVEIVKYWWVFAVAIAMYVAVFIGCLVLLKVNIFGVSR